MRTPAARALHLGLFGLGVVLYVVFVLPRWWVLTGVIPPTLATVGRIAAGIPIAAAAWPVMQLLKAGLAASPRPPELALRLRAWSGVLHLVAGALIVLAAIAEIWLRLQVGGPWLFGVYGAAAAIAVLGLLALYLSFVAEQPPAGPKPAKEKKAPRAKKPKKAKTAKPDAAETAVDETIDETVDETVDETIDETLVADETIDETLVADETAAVIVHAAASDGEDTTTDGAPTSASAPRTSGLRNKRPSTKSRRR
jgi:hypothetical protein